jgi:methionine salvage enolase-phosphatase E1
LINAHQFEADTSEWKKYLDAIEYRQIYSNQQSTNELYIFSSTSFHALTFFFIKEGSNEMFLDSQYSKGNIKILMSFFMRNANSDSKTLLKSISKIIDVYQSNETAGSKIPVAPN